MIVARHGWPALADEALLNRAWRRVRANKGGPGGDGLTIEAFEHSAGGRLDKLARALTTASYRPGPPRRIVILKPNGARRVIMVPCITDRVAQTALLMRLAPGLDARMSEASFAYRPRRGVADALKEARRARADGLGWAVETDIEACFDTIPHRRLLDELSIWLDEEEWIRLIGLWLRCGSWRRLGIPQGFPISPLLCNLYLHPFDRTMGAAGHHVIRYADDLVLGAATREAAIAGLAYARYLLGARGLRLKRAKTRLVAPAEAYDFLGQTIAPVAPKSEGRCHPVCGIGQ